MTITQKHIVAWLQKSAEVLFEHSDLLTELDSAIGDADHGINMKRGFEAVLKRMDKTNGIGDLFKGAAMALISSVGGAAGPLYGTIYLELAKVFKDRSELGDEDIELLIATGVRAIQMRGKAEANDKTMLDSWLPASVAIAEARRAGADPRAALETMTQAAEQGMKDTIPLIARKGRASYLGERSRGHQDPGATSSWLILRSLAEAITGADTATGAGETAKAEAAS